MAELSTIQNNFNNKIKYTEQSFMNESSKNISDAYLQNFGT